DPESSLLPVVNARRAANDWMKVRDYRGWEPYDLLNSPYLSGPWMRSPLLAIPLLQGGRRFLGSRARTLLRVPLSKNPKALGLLLSGYCDLARCGEDCESEARYLKAELIRLRSPNEELFCWGYDWDFVSWRGPTMAAFTPNSIATYFCASALLDFAEMFHDPEARAMAESAGEFFVRRLNRSVDLEDGICFSYTPTNQTLIYNSSALVGAFLMRLAAASGNRDYRKLAGRSMNFLARAQRADGSWPYGAKSRQQWIDHFHTAYNLSALLDYIRLSGDPSHEEILKRGYDFYRRNLFAERGAPKYFHDRPYPIDIHSCAQAVLTFCAFSSRDASALKSAFETAQWTIENLKAPEGCFYFQRHRFWTNRTPYMRWGQAWMFLALSRLELTIRARGRG
ncbi:MAG: hypothetical protein WAM69_17190, partial [Candidatus Sulfotelmatobacter sp.]